MSKVTMHIVTLSEIHLCNTGISHFGTRNKTLTNNMTAYSMLKDTSYTVRQQEQHASYTYEIKHIHCL